MRYPVESFAEFEKKKSHWLPSLRQLAKSSMVEINFSDGESHAAHHREHGEHLGGLIC